MKRFIGMLLAVCLSFTTLKVFAEEHKSVCTPDEAMQKLAEGNSRYCNNKPQPWGSGSETRKETAQGQHPWACVITCADSRVCPEEMFDQPIGNLFVCRVAGNVVSEEIAGSIEYAVEHLKVPLVVVLGHTKCGAVSAACANGDYSYCLSSLTDRIKPAVDACIDKGYWGDELAPAVCFENAKMGCAKLLNLSRAVDEAVNRNECKIYSGVYDLSSGKVQWQTQTMAATATTKLNESSTQTAASKSTATTKKTTAGKVRKSTETVKETTHDDEHSDRKH